MNEQAAVEVVTAYLRFIEERRLAEAAELLAPGVEIVFPGGRSFSSLAEQVAAAGTRYRSIRKVFNGYDVVDGGEATIVYVYGELEGEDLTGTSFAGVRFIDRFELVDGLITNHRVWNDLAEAMRDRESE